VSLGCGTLILIALIVLFFSNRGNEDNSQLQNDIKRLQSQVANLQRSIDDQAAKLTRIEQEIQRRDNKQ